MAELIYRIEDRGHDRVVTMGGRIYPPTRYSTRVIEMLIERKGERAPLYFPFRAERAPLYLDPLFRWLRAHGARDLAVLEVGCSFGHMTEYLAEQPEVGTITTFDVDGDFVEIVRAKVQEMGLEKVRQVERLTNDETRRLPWRDAAFDLVLAIGVIEHLPWDRRALVDEYYRVLAPGGHIAVLDTPNRLFPLDSHSTGLPLTQWLPAPLAYEYTRRLSPHTHLRDITYDVFTADGTGWRHATLGQCLPSSGWRGITDVTEQAGYGWRFFRDQLQRSRARRSRLGRGSRRAALPLFGACAAALRAVGLPPSLCLPYFNLLLRKDAAGRTA
jgi:ubiquinone/menaquinone biosynthesis C-methylase UbiE